MSASEIVNMVSTCLPMVGTDKFHYAHVLRNDGMGYLPASQCSVQTGGDFIEHIACLIFLTCFGKEGVKLSTTSRKGMQIKNDYLFR